MSELLEAIQQLLNSATEDESGALIISEDALQRLESAYQEIR